MDMLKICTKCGIEKELGEFCKDKHTKDGLSYICRSCAKEKNAKWHKENAEEQNKKSAIWRAENAENIKEYSAKYRAENAENIKESGKKYRENPESKIKRNISIKKKRTIDPLYKLTMNIRCLINNSIKNNRFKKTSNTSNILGCTFEFLKVHIESQFQEGMIWDNIGLWHLDHFVPVSIANSKEDILYLNRWFNLRPLWAVDNLKKHNNYPYTLKFELGVVTIIPFLEIDGLFIRNRISNYKKIFQHYQKIFLTTSKITDIILP